MRLSDAMMLGATLRRHVNHAGTHSEGCALQLAMAAVNYTAVAATWQEIFPVGGVRVCCPECGKGPISVDSVVMCLNDNHKWFIERIADWVRLIEDAQVAGEESTVQETEEVQAT